MNRKNRHALLFSALAFASVLTGCSTTSAKDSQGQRPADRSSLNASSEGSTDSRTAENSTEKNKTANNNTDKNTSKNPAGSTSGTSDEEDKNDDLELSGLKAVEGTAIDLGSLSSNALIEKGGTYTLSGSTDKTVVVDAKNEDVTLVLDKATIKAKALPAIYVRNAKSVSVEAKSASTLSSESHEQADALNAALYVRSTLSIKGNSSLTITDKEGHGIKAKDDMTSSAVNMTVTSGKDGIHASDSLTITGGSYNITSGDEGMEANADLKVTGGTFTIHSTGDGLHADENLELSNGTYVISAESEGLESKGTLLIKNGTYTIDSRDDGINAATSLTIQNGTLNIVSSGNDAMDSNGDLILEGGTIHAVALSPAEGAFDTDNTPFEIKGGTVVGLSATASLPTECKQNTVMINAGKSFSTLELKQDGKTLISWKNDSGASNGQQSGVLTLSSKDLVSGKEAEVYLDGTLLESFTVEDGLTKVGTIQTMGGGRGGQGMMGQPGQMQPGQGQMPEGQMPEGQQGERPELPSDQMPEDGENGGYGRMPGGRRMPGGQMPQDRMNESAGEGDQTEDGTTSRSQKPSRRSNETDTDSSASPNENQNGSGSRSSNSTRENARSSAADSASL